MNARRFLRITIALATAAVLLAGTAPALARPLRRPARLNTHPRCPARPPAVTPPNAAVPLAGDRGPVPAGVRVAGRDIGGLTESEARSVIHAFVRPDALPSLDLTADGRTFTLTAGAAFYVDTRAMLDQAYAATGPTDRPGAVGRRHPRRTRVRERRGPEPSTATAARREVVRQRQAAQVHRAIMAGRRIGRIRRARRGVLAALAAEARTGAAAAGGRRRRRLDPGRAGRRRTSAERSSSCCPSGRCGCTTKGDIMKTYKCAVGSRDTRRPPATSRSSRSATCRRG